MKYKIIAAAVIVLSLLVFFSIRFFNMVQEDEWKVQRNAVETAYQKTILTKANKVESFVSDQPYTIIFGEDKIGQSLIVWVGKESIYTQMAVDGITAEQAEQLVLGRQPEAKVLRLMPGIVNGNPVWEAFYKVIPENERSGRYYYDYYAFHDGAYIDTYRLSIE
ncbi:MULTISPECIES: cell wall elongation regulator TseB-like domain-containing protein [unclassified Paenibacillus]|uniref:cell wall elongation regulator TseB-like domain-containing protein n=1 Tax=unclassified Paenibacillus TaxID=185978 RepID=UPI0036354B15